MSLKSQENTRAVELSFYLGLAFAAGTVDCFDITNVSLDNLVLFKSLVLNVYTIDFMTSLWRERLTEEHDKLNESYKIVLSCFSDLMHKVGINNPVQIFAAFVYLYRHNYLTYGSGIKYSSNLKDFAGLQGIDVIRGRVVCRSLANMLNDIYQYMDYQTKTIPVKATKEFLNKGISLGDMPLLDDENSKFFELPFGSNHLINMVKDNNKNYIFDPTNDLFLLYKDKRIVLANDLEEKMKYYPLSWLLSGIWGLNNQGVNIKQFMEQLMLPSISFEEYSALYLEAIAKLKEKRVELSLFNDSTNFAMDSINVIGNRQDSVLRRLIPLVPKRKVN